MYIESLSIYPYYVAQLVNNSACNVGDLSLNPGLGRSPEEGKATSPVFWSGEFHDCIVHGVTKSRT